MSYQALYRKYRPQTFDDVKGQEHIVKSMCNQVENNRVGHAYLYCGTRGTGKTTVAKIMARAVNCEHHVGGSPCGECDSCKAILEGRSMSVIEIDAASNNGVDNVREIIEEVSYPPVDGKYKVYIIDEVHMLSRAAFNALLKTLEEPPAYALFILATTDPQQVPITILSRCQRYDFRHISVETIAARITELMGKEATEVEESAIRYVALAADGSMRDALSILDQCLAFHYGEKLTYDMVLDILGAVDTTVFSELLRAVLVEDVIACIHLLDKVVYSGRELNQFVTDFIWYLRNLMLAKSSGGSIGPEALQMSTENYEALLEEAGKMELSTVLRYIGVFSELSASMRYASQKRIMIEMTLIRLCKPQMDKDFDSVLDRVRDLEEKVESGNIVVAGSQNTMAAEPVVAKTLDRALPEDIKQVAREWGGVLAKLSDISPILAAVLKKAVVSVDDRDVLLICSSDSMMQSLSDKEENKEKVATALAEQIGKEVPFEFRVAKDDVPVESQFVNLLDFQEQFGIPILEEDEEE